MVSIADLAAIGVETPNIDRGCYFEKYFFELIPMNTLIDT